MDESKKHIKFPSNIYSLEDLAYFQSLPSTAPVMPSRLSTIDELLERDNQREKDGFPRKINVGRIIRPGKGGKDKIVVVPSTIEEKFYHDRRTDASEESGGTGEGEEGDVIGRQPVRAPDGSGTGPGDGDGGSHEMESNAYELGKILTEKFELPNLKDKGKKRSLTRYSYDMTDRHRGFGQVLDKKATLKKIIETNISLGKIPDRDNIDTSGLLVSPGDRIFRILSRERDYESQAMIFFIRDYSGSMEGRPTTLVVSQHVLIYSWLLFQYSNQVESRFVLHDTSAMEVPDFHTYYNSRVAGGTQVASGYRLVNEIVEKENLAKDYNIYVFHGTDGDDWEGKGQEAVDEIKKMLTYVSRMGITVAKHSSSTTTAVEKYMNESKLLTEQSELIRMDVIPDTADEARIIEGIKTLISSGKVKTP